MIAALREFRGAGGVLGGLVLLVIALIAAAASWIAPGDPLNMVARPLTQPFADPRYLLGTDQLGRNVLAGLVHGARVSMSVGAAAAAAAICVGILVGTMAGFSGRRIDNGLMRITEAFQTVPTFLLALALVSVLGASALNVVVAIGISSWPPTARLVRAEVLRLKGADYVDAARLAGRGSLAIAFMEVLPGALQPVVALIGVTVGEAILVESALAFLGLSDPNLVSWGGMIANGRALLRTAPYLVVLPGLAIAIAVLCVTLAGDGLANRLGIVGRR
ncbi:MAG: ABC transporter permease [Alphaproteobacteria bacterium]|nr:ABC transporter permease [Alphaproteobacteria bacterium]